MIIIMFQSMLGNVLKVNNYELLTYIILFIQYYNIKLDEYYSFSSW